MNAEMLANTVEVELIYEEVKYMAQVKGEDREGGKGRGRGGDGREGEGRGEVVQYLVVVRERFVTLRMC